MIINLSKIDFGGIATGGGKTKPEETFDVQPTTAEQTITPTEGSVFSGGTVRAVTSEIDVNIVSNNIKEGVTILGVAGTLKEEKPEESFNVQPTTAEQTITPTEGSVFSGGTVHAVTSEIDINIIPENIKEGVSILGVAGTLSGGSGVFVAPDGTKFSNSTFTELPSNVDTSNMTNMESMFSNCLNLTTIPQLNTSNVTNMMMMFDNCQKLVSIPKLDTSKVTVMNVMFNNCQLLTDIPQLNTSNVTGMYNMFSNCSSLTTIPLLDTSKVDNMESMFKSCSNLTTIPQLDTSNVIYMYQMFQDCSNLTTIPQLDTSNVINMSGMFGNCNLLTNIPSMNTSKVTSMSEMFFNCSSLTTIPSMDTSNVTSMDFIFAACSNLTTIEGIDFSGLTSSPYYLFYLPEMPNLTHFIVNGKINVSISDEYSIKALTTIDYDSVKSILEAANRTDNTDAKTLVFNRTMTDQNGELAALVASCTSKGWTISGLTLQ